MFSGTLDFRLLVCLNGCDTSALWAYYVCDSLVCVCCGVGATQKFQGFDVCCSLWAFGLFGCCVDVLFELFCGVVCLPENCADFTACFRLLDVGY